MDIDVKHAVRRELRVFRVPHADRRGAMDDLAQDVRVEVLQWLQTQGDEVETAELDRQVRNAAQRVVRHWIESRKQSILTSEVRDEDTPYVIGDNTGELPAWIPAELRQVAMAIIELSAESTEVGKPARLPYAELCRLLDLSEATLYRRILALRSLSRPTKQTTGYSAVSERRNRRSPDAWYTRVGCTPMVLGDIPQTQAPMPWTYPQQSGHASWYPGMATTRPNDNAKASGLWGQIEPTAGKGGVCRHAGAIEVSRFEEGECWTVETAAGIRVHRPIIRR